MVGQNPVDFKFNLTAFSSQMFWDEPQEGLFEVDVGLQNLTNQHLMVFADMNSDKYTDIITIDSDGKSFSIYLFNKKQAQF